MAEDLDHPPVVGCCYRVRQVFVPRRIGYGGNAGKWWAVYGPLHRDKELGGAGLYHHYHLFLPFLSEAQLASLTTVGEGGEYGQVAIAAVAFPVFSNIFTRKRTAVVRCLREWPAYPVAAARGMRERLVSYHQPLPPGCAKCPHRGFNLGLVRPDAQGIVTCPGHGLRWVAATGEPWRGEASASSA